MVIAEATLGFGDKAVEYFRMINPIEHSKTKNSVMKYKVEPYVIPADVYGQGNLAGRGGWTWYTGSSSWMYIAGIKNILGINIEDGYLSLKPAIDREWKDYSVRLKYNNTVYNINVKNSGNINNEVKKVTINGVELKDKKIKLNENAGICEVSVEI